MIEVEKDIEVKEVKNVKSKSSSASISASSNKSSKSSKVSTKDNTPKESAFDKSKKAYLSIDKKIDKLSYDNFSDSDVKSILSLIDKEIEKSTERMAMLSDKDNKALKEEAALYEEYTKLSSKLFNKVSNCVPFESFFYSEDSDKETMLIDFFKSINNEIHWLDLDNIDFNSDHKVALNEKTNVISQSLIDVLEEKLNVNFSSSQKNRMKKDFSAIADNVNNEDLEDIINECNKIKTVSSIKLISRPSYKNFISKNELKKSDPSKKLSTIRVDFLNYITLSKKEKLANITENLDVQLRSIKDILENEKEEYSKKMKLLFLLILMSGALTLASPVPGALGIITIGSAAAYMQSKVIMASNKIKSIDEELDNIKHGTSKIIDETYEKLEETSKELLNDKEYSEVAKLYIKKKKEALKAKEIKEKVEKQMRETILDSLDKMSDAKKDKIAVKVKDKYKVQANDKDKVKDNDQDLSFDVQLEL